VKQQDSSIHSDEPFNTLGKQKIGMKPICRARIQGFILEAAVNGVEDMLYISSTSDNDGSYGFVETTASGLTWRISCQKIRERGH